MLILKLLVILITSILTAFAYRFGGCSKEEGKLKYPYVPDWLFKSWVRDCFCSVLPVLAMLVIYPKVPWFVYVATIGLSWASLSTYWDWVFGEDNFYFHGFMIALSYLWFPLFTGLWATFILRCVILALLAGIISAESTDVDVEELGRGGSIGVTLALFLIR